MLKCHVFVKSQKMPQILEEMNYFTCGVFRFKRTFFLFEYSISQLTSMNEQEEVLLEQFVTLPQLKQVITDRDELVKSIEELASKLSKC